MFPEHLMHRSLRSFPTFSIDALKSDTRGPPLTQFTSSRPTPPSHHLQPARRWLPSLSTARAHSSSGSSDGDFEEGNEGEDDEDSTGAEEGKRHACPTCAKRFNRPSSLRIHVNTHTGATRESWFLLFNFSYFIQKFNLC
jgi:uncharacterized Zn-finger protein